MDEPSQADGNTDEIEKWVGFKVAHQKVELDIDLQAQRYKGRTVITIHPQNESLRTIRLNLRQCKLTKIRVARAAGGEELGVSYSYNDPYDHIRLPWQASVHQHHILAGNIEPATSSPPQKELTITLPKKLRIEHVHQTTVHTDTQGTVQIRAGTSADINAPEPAQGIIDASVAEYTPLVITAEFQSKEIRDGLHFVNYRPGSGRFPYVYTRNTVGPGSASCLFPCVDELEARCPWDITIRAPRTIDDVLAEGSSEVPPSAPGGTNGSTSRPRTAYDAREMIVLCSGEVTDETVDKADPSKKLVSFSSSQILSAQQIGFAIGPFEYVNLSSLRGAQEDEILGQNAVQLAGYCLPGRSEDLRNTCLPTARAMDFFVQKFTPCPSTSFTICFVDDLAGNTSIGAGLCFCSNRMLYPEDIIDVAEDVTRALVHAVAYQWVGIDIIPREPTDTWLTVGIAYYMTDMFMRELCGNNEYRFRMKQQSDRVCELDHERPSIFRLGTMLQVDPSQLEFIALKAPLVLFILDRRIAKAAGAPKMPSIISKILMKARLDDMQDRALTTELFQKSVEKTHHAKIDDFLAQWVRGAGCPNFRAAQRFNKKKLVVELTIAQLQGEPPTEVRPLDPSMFMRDVKEDFTEVFADGLQTAFTGQMTVRIHEADGTPYEHIIDIKDVKQTFEIPYNTKYKRLKRSRRQRERDAAAAAMDPTDTEGESLVYCLGDVLQSETEMADWKLSQFSPEEEEKMNSESYEWIRLDADFEWLCKIAIILPGYMFLSQLQQDRDIVAQHDSMKYLSHYESQPLVATFMVRTMMDRRYFHGIRTMAAMALARHAKEDLDFVGLHQLKKAFEELFGLSESGAQMIRPNEFSNRPAYYLQCKIVEAISKVRNAKGVAPGEVKEFLLDQLKFNDNSQNVYSDNHYVANLLRAICHAVAAKPKSSLAEDVDLMDVDAEEQRSLQHRHEQECLAEVDRHRRMDEWTSSFQNLYTRTALECQLQLFKAEIGRVTTMHLLQYTRPGCFEMLRLTAFECLVQQQLFDQPSILRYFLYCLASDQSSYIRDSLTTLFGQALASMALTGRVTSKEIAIDELQVDAGDQTETRQAEMARKTTIDGALEALKKEIAGDDGLKTALWSAVNSPYVGMQEVQSLLDFCQMLYEPTNELKLTLQYPRYWKVQLERKVRETSKMFGYRVLTI